MSGDPESRHLNEQSTPTSANRSPEKRLSLEISNRKKPM